MFRLTHNNSLPAKLYELSLIEEEKTFYLSNSCLCDQNSPVVKTFNTLTAFPFPLLCKTKEDIFLRWNWLPYGSALNSPCLVQSPLSVQCIKTVPWPNIQHTLCISFSSSLWDQVFASQIKTKEEFCWVKLTPLRISSKVTHNSCTKSTLCSANKDSPVAKTFSTLTAFPFPLSCGTKSLHHRLRLRKSFVGWNWLLYGSALKSPITLVQSLLSVLQIKTVQ